MANRRSSAAANAACDAMAALCDGGYLRLYDGEQPPSADMALFGQQLLAELRFGTPAFAPAEQGIALANAIAEDESAERTGVATWFRVVAADGERVVWDGSVGTPEARGDLVMGAASIVAGAAVQVTAIALTERKG